MEKGRGGWWYLWICSQHNNFVLLSRRKVIHCPQSLQLWLETSEIIPVNPRVPVLAFSLSLSLSPRPSLPLPSILINCPSTAADFHPGSGGGMGECKGEKAGSSIPTRYLLGKKVAVGAPSVHKCSACEKGSGLAKGKGKGGSLGGKKKRRLEQYSPRDPLGTASPMQRESLPERLRQEARAARREKGALEH